MQKQLEALGVETVYTTTYPADATNFQTIASAIAAAKPDLIAQGAVFEDGVGLVRSLQQLNYSPKMLFQTSAPEQRRPVQRRHRRGEHRGRLLHGQLEREGDDAEQRGVRRRVRKRFDGGIPAEDAADAYAAAQVVQAAVETVGSLDQDKLADWLHANEVETILGPLAWDETGAPTKRLPARPVAERRGGDRRPGGRCHGRHGGRQDALAVTARPVARARTGHRTPART